jgi:NAD(P)-dependent dehydrogenase (short-subunit alcohol dehydrogenase family)
MSRTAKAEGQVVVITDGTRGIGLTAATAPNHVGAKVAIVTSMRCPNTKPDKDFKECDKLCRRWRR